MKGVRFTNYSGKYTGNGDGTTKTFEISHVLTTTPQWAVATSGISGIPVESITYDTTKLYVTLAEAPESGTGNVVINWIAGL